MKLIFHLLCLCCTSSSLAQKSSYMFVGTYTNTSSTGIYVFRFDEAEGGAILVDSIKTSNPSYLSVSADQKFVYAVGEDNQTNGGGKVKAYAFDKQHGKLRFLNEQEANGDHPCYIATDQSGRWLTVGNYTSGGLAMYPLNPDGTINKASAVIQHFGQSINRDRQSGPHVHATVFSPDGKYLAVPDLGIDKVMVYEVDKVQGKLQAHDSLKQAPGAGPRHFDFHPSGKWAYLINELSGTVASYSSKKGKFKHLQTISSLPVGVEAHSSADIHCSPDGKFLYASNRDPSNTIAIYRINRSSGKLTLSGHQSTLGKTPRNFSIDPSGNYLLVANQNTNDIIVFRIDHLTGLLTDTGNRISVGKPVCIKWAR